MSYETPIRYSASTTAYYLQSVLSFAVALAGVLAGVFFLPVNVWVRGFLGMGLLYVVTSTFTLAKCIRDQHEAAGARAAAAYAQSQAQFQSNYPEPYAQQVA